MKGLISCTSWVRRGVSASNPETYEVDEKEIERISALARINIEEARAELLKASDASQDFEGLHISSDGEEYEGNGSDEEDVDMVVQDDTASEAKVNKLQSLGSKNELAEYNLDDYDENDKPGGQGIFSNIKGLSYYADNSEDPYVTKDDEDDEERQELRIMASDNLVVVAKTEDHVSSLEVYVYDESEDNLYVHHDILLPSFPICLEWLDFPPGSSADGQKTGNLVALGTLDPEIEIWSLDVIEPMYPNALLGRPDKSQEAALKSKKSKKNKQSKKPKTNPDHHVDSVLGLSWNTSHRNLLASASADRTIKLWDLSRDLNAPALRSYGIHSDKVQAVQWNKQEPTVLLSGGYDRTVRTFDSRSPDSGYAASLPSDVEALKWDPWEEHSFYVSLENGLVLYYDARTLSSDLKKPVQPQFTLQAHDGATSALDVNTQVRGCIATGGTDELVKLWNVVEDGGNASVSLITSRNLEIGKVFSVTWSPDDPLTLAAGGSQGKLRIWDAGAKKGVRGILDGRLPNREWRERDGDGLIGLVDDGEDDDEDWEDE